MKSCRAPLTQSSEDRQRLPVEDTRFFRSWSQYRVNCPTMKIALASSSTQDVGDNLCDTCNDLLHVSPLSGYFKDGDAELQAVPSYPGLFKAWKFQ